MNTELSENRYNYIPCFNDVISQRKVGDFNKVFQLNFGVYKLKPLGEFPFRKIHRALIEVHDRDLQQKCCSLAGIESTGDDLVFAYGCVDEDAGLIFHIVGGANRGKGPDWWISIPEERQFFLTYEQMKTKMISLSDSYAEAFRNCKMRCKELITRHEKNSSIMWYALDPFRNSKQPLDVQISLVNENGEKEFTWFRPIRASGNTMVGKLVKETGNASFPKGSSLEVWLLSDEKGNIIEVTSSEPEIWDKKGFVTLGEIGSENGIIVEDEEYKGISRITMEDCQRNFAITCGMYGVFVHTTFCGENEAYDLYKVMKLDLQYISDCYLSHGDGDISDLIEEFVEHYSQ